MSVNGMLKKSRYYPKIGEVRGLNIDYYQIDPDLIEFDELDSLKLLGATQAAIDYVIQRSEKEKCEYSIVLYGETRVSSRDLCNYIFERGNRNSVKYSYVQMEHVASTKRTPCGCVVYGHTHVSDKKNYKCFSVLDLKFLIEKAMYSYENEYALLITKDGLVCVKYDIQREEFFRVKIS